MELTAERRIIPRDFVIARQWRGRNYLISPLIDFLMVGGAGLILALLMYVYIPRNVTNEANAGSYSAVLAAFVTYHIFALNYPHFAASYQIAYTRRAYARNDSPLPPLVRLRYRFALFYFPILFLVYCAYALYVQADHGLALLGFLVNLMFLTVGWHYCKQCFGILMVLSAVKGIYYSVWERRILLTHVTLIWILAWLRGNIVAYKSQYWGVPYRSFGLSNWADVALLQRVVSHGMTVLMVLLAASVAVIIYNGIRTKRVPSLTAALGYFMVYPLLIVSGFFHPLWLWILPGIHSLQYLLFVFAYRQGQVAHMFPEKAAGEEGHAQSASALRHHALGSFVALAVLIGAVQFSWLPHALNALVNPAHTYHLPLMFMALCHLFVNIHHYFIDNVIWRKENPEVGKYLMGKRA